MERPVDPYNYGYNGGGGGEDAAFLAIFGAFMFVGFLLAVVIYVVTAIFLMKLLRNAGHKSPAAAWVPLWNQVALFEIAGIKQPWAWVGVIFGASIISNFIPLVGIVISLAILAASIVLSVYMAKGVQAGLGINSVGGIVLAVLVPLAWIIWMSVASGKRKYDRNAALMEGGSLPMNWFGENDRLAPFGVAGTPAYGAYSQSQQYGGSAPQNYGTPQGNQHYAAPQQATPTASQSGWPAAQQGGWNAPQTPEEGVTENGKTDLPQTPPAPPASRYDSPLPPQRNEDEDETDRGGRQI